MPKWFPTLAVTSVLLCFGAQAAQSPPDLLGFSQTSVGQSLATSAAHIANDVLSSNSNYRLVGSWWPTTPPEFAEKRIITIYLIEKTPGESVFNIMVPYDCDCIFVQPDVLKDATASYTRQTETTMKVALEEALAFMLLHELGHVEHGDPGSLMDVKSRSDFNLDDTAQKTKERLADEFAADTLVASANSKNSVPSFLAAMKVEMALGAMSFNLSKIRIVDHLGSDVLCSRNVFYDDGETHPNFELRILHVNDIISHTKESGELVASFERCRKGARSAVIYRKR